LPSRRPTLKSLRAIERAFADVENLFAGLADRACLAGREAARKVKMRAQPRRKLRIAPKPRGQCERLEPSLEEFRVA